MRKRLTIYLLTLALLTLTLTTPATSQTKRRPEGRPERITRDVVFIDVSTEAKFIENFDRLQRIASERFAALVIGSDADEDQVNTAEQGLFQQLRQLNIHPLPTCNNNDDLQPGRRLPQILPLYERR